MQTLEKTLAKLDTDKAVAAFLTDLCTPAERRAMTERWTVAQLLEQDELSYRDIRAKTGVSTTTIGRVARFLRDEPHGGYRYALDKIADEKSKVET
jgi:TrpR-related protein YerC/YecD